MKLDLKPFDEAPLISLDELKSFVRLDYDSFDAALLEFLEAGISEFQARTKRILKRSKASVILNDERVYFAPLNAILRADFIGTLDTKGDLFLAQGRGEFLLDLGYEPQNLEAEIKLWLKNYVLCAFENQALPKMSDKLISRYAIRLF